MKGKCYSCGSPEHMANACIVAKDVKCKKCNTTGHMLRASRVRQEQQRIGRTLPKI